LLVSSDHVPDSPAVGTVGYERELLESNVGEVKTGLPILGSTSNVSLPKCSSLTEYVPDIGSPMTKSAQPPPPEVIAIAAEGAVLSSLTVTSSAQ
jgi:hypothetical protein